MQLLSHNAGTLREGNGSCEVVSGDHADVNASPAVVCHSWGHIGPRRVLDTYDPQESQFRFHRETGDATSVFHQGILLVGITRGHIFVCEKRVSRCLPRGKADEAEVGILAPAVILGLEMRFSDQVPLYSGLPIIEAS